MFAQSSKLAYRKHSGRRTHRRERILGIADAVPALLPGSIVRRAEGAKRTFKVFRQETVKLAETFEKRHG
jgi:hypothetical protein